MCVCLIHFRLFVTPWTVAHQALLSTGFPSKKTGVGCHFLLQGISRDRTQGASVSCIGRQILYHCTTWDKLQTGATEDKFLVILLSAFISIRQHVY